MDMVIINKIFYYIAIYTPLAIFILDRLGIFKNFYQSILDIDLNYRGKNLFIYYLDIFKTVSIALYFAIGLVGSVAILFGAFSELKDGISDSYYILKAIRAYIEFALVATFAVSFKFDKPWLVAIFSYLFLNIYYLIFGSFVALKPFWAKYLLINLINLA